MYSKEDLLLDEIITFSVREFFWHFFLLCPVLCHPTYNSTQSCRMPHTGSQSLRVCVLSRPFSLRSCPVVVVDTPRSTRQWALQTGYLLSHLNVSKIVHSFRLNKGSTELQCYQVKDMFYM